MVIIYKIRDKNTGLFIAKNWRLYLNKTGKIWKRKSDLRSSLKEGAHLFQHLKYRYPDLDLEVVEYEIVEKKTINLSDW